MTTTNAATQRQVLADTILDFVRDLTLTHANLSSRQIAWRLYRIQSLQIEYDVAFRHDINPSDPPPVIWEVR